MDRHADGGNRLLAAQTQPAFDPRPPSCARLVRRFCGSPQIGWRRQSQRAGRKPVKEQRFTFHGQPVWQSMQRIITHISSSKVGMLITLVTNLGRLAALDRHTSTSMSSPCTRRLYWGTPVVPGPLLREIVKKVDKDRSAGSLLGNASIKCGRRS